MQQKAARFPFTDLHSFKDYVVFVQTCLPDRFPRREGAAVNAQWTVELAFDGLAYGFVLAVAEGAPATAISECRAICDSAIQAYLAGDRRQGFFALERVSAILKEIPLK